MSRVGKKSIEIPKGVKVALDHQIVNVEGPKGKLSFNLHPRIKAVLKENIITVSPATQMKTDRALQGTSRSVINNMILGVTNGYVKELSIEGVGFKATVQGKQLHMLLGFTHPVIFDLPEGVVVEAPKPTQVFVRGIDKVKVGQFAAKVRKAFEAEPYKGKGIKYAGEVIRRKAGKTVTK
jgi:large subunit ribosomal protein L6